MLMAGIVEWSTCDAKAAGDASPSGPRGVSGVGLAARLLGRLAVGSSRWPRASINPRGFHLQQLQFIRHGTLEQIEDAGPLPPAFKASH
jgi:hypothetical protein